MPLAVGAGTSSARFLIGENPSQGGLSLSASETPYYGEIEVAMDSLDHIVRGGRVPRPDFIKMDIEGGEDEALAGAREVLSQPNLTLLLSTHGWKHHKHCWSLLEKAGFLLQLARNGGVDGNYLILASAQ